ncbi:palmitoyltransferase ZDHHC6-like [Branchiostoma floridae x Branchiostoma belcheri]
MAPRIDWRDLRRLCHWGPMVALFIIIYCYVMGVGCILIWWPPVTAAGVAHLIVYTAWELTILYNFFYAMLLGPGFVPLGWQPEKEADCQFLQYCKQCKGYKSPRSHHCRKCKRCVMKMDHHCPWINTCCGHLNHTRFILFLLSAPLGCLHATVVYGCTMYRYLYLGSSYYYLVEDDDLEPLIDVDLYFFAMLFFATGLSIGVTVAVGILFSIQMKIVLTNQTGIETWILDKAKDRPRLEGDKFVYPYHLGWRRNFWEVFAWQGYPRGDGITWPVVEGCDQYTLTVEQLLQKEDKRNRSVEFAIVDNYSGSWFPITKGIRVCCCIPCTEEPRIKVKRGDVVMVTRAYRKWLYGEKVTRIKDGPPEKGWFPRPCAEKIINELHYPQQNQADDFEHDKKED